MAVLYDVVPVFEKILKEGLETLKVGSHWGENLLKNCLTNGNLKKYEFNMKIIELVQDMRFSYSNVRISKAKKR